MQTNKYMNKMTQTNQHLFLKFLNSNQVARYNRITGSEGKSVEEVCQHNIIDRHISSSKASTFSDKSNMSKFLHTYLKENLFKKKWEVENLKV